MKILLFGATGMVGEGVLRWLVTVPEVSRVAAVSRRALAFRHGKVETIVEPDMFHFQHVDALVGFEACLFCLGSTSVGKTPEVYRQLTFDLTLAVAHQLLPRNPAMVFEYISGEGTDRESRRRWARVKAETEDAILAAGFRDAYALRPGFIQPMRGAISREKWMRRLYAGTAPLYPLIRRFFGEFATDTDRLAEAMLELVRAGSPQKTLNTADLNAIAARHNRD